METIASARPADTAVAVSGSAAATTAKPTKNTVVLLDPGTPRNSSIAYQSRHSSMQQTEVASSSISGRRSNGWVWSVRMGNSTSRRRSGAMALKAIRSRILAPLLFRSVDGPSRSSGRTSCR
jgi:hypothetical protein